ncbi:MAG: type I secretion system permease/ATPase [Rhodobacteraceae bacterium]|nr:type I secretion system permease/ATPase [Paracoccaceae bacterium]
MSRTQKAGQQTVSPNVYRGAILSLRPALATVLTFSALINVLMLTGSIYMLQIYGRVLASGSVATLLGLFGIVVVLYAFLAVYDFLRSRLLSRASLNLDNMAGQAAFGAWLRSGLPDDKTATEEAQPLRDLDAVRGFLSGPAVTAMFDLPFVPLFLLVLFVIHPWLGMMTVAGAAIGGVIALINRAVTQSAINKSAALDGADRSFADQGRRSAEAIVAMGMQDAVTARWRDLHDRALASGQNGSDPSEILAAASRAFRMLLQSAMLTLGAFLVLRGEISPGMIIASSILSGRALAPIDQLIGQWRAIGRGIAAHRRLEAVFEAVPEVTERIELPSPTGQISVSGLTKLGPARPGTEPIKILSGIEFSLEPGDGLGVIGNSASGKSTLARLLVGAGQADAGEIRLDGATMDQWSPARLGRRIGYLPQSPEMLPGTIRETISRFDPNAADADVIAAAQLTGVHEMILGLPHGYATRLGGGAGEAPPLSGGQMQRLGLARAVFGMPALVVLDEPNSNLDIAGDEALTHVIKTLRAANSVVIVMAHRPSALAGVNKLMILDAGKIALFGDKEAALAEDKPADSQPKVAAFAKPSGRRPSVARMAGPNRTRRSA